MMDLPSGQVLLDNESATPGFQIYTPVGAPTNTWRPVITGITNNGGGNYTMSGTQLTGHPSEGASFGDEATMATNYPIIQLTDSGGNVTYAPYHQLEQQHRPRHQFHTTEAPSSSRCPPVRLFPTTPPSLSPPTEFPRFLPRSSNWAPPMKTSPSASIPAIPRWSRSS